MLCDNRRDSSEKEGSILPVPCPIVCSRQGFKQGPGYWRQFQGRECNIMIHVSCFDWIQAKYKLKNFPEESFSCTKLCYTNSVKEIEQVRKETNGLLQMK